MYPHLQSAPLCPDLALYGTWPHSLWWPFAQGLKVMSQLVPSLNSHHGSSGHTQFSPLPGLAKGPTPSPKSNTPNQQSFCPYRFPPKSSVSPPARFHYGHSSPGILTAFLIPWGKASCITTSSSAPPGLLFSSLRHQLQAPRQESTLLPVGVSACLHQALPRMGLPLFLPPPSSEFSALFQAQLHLFQPRGNHSP